MLRNKIQETIKSLNMSESQLKEASKLHWQQIIDKIEETFISKDKYNSNVYPYWEKLKDNCFSISFEDNDAFKVLDILVNKDEKVWLLVQDDKKMWLYEGYIETIMNLIEECYAFEYYIISKKFLWLLCENHHGCLIGVGNPVIERMKKLKHEES